MVDTSIDLLRTAEPKVYTLFLGRFGKVSLAILENGRMLMDRDSPPPDDNRQSVTFDEDMRIPIREIYEFTPQVPLISECYLAPDAAT